MRHAKPQSPPPKVSHLFDGSITTEANCLRIDDIDDIGDLRGLHLIRTVNGQTLTFR